MHSPRQNSTAFRGGRADYPAHSKKAGDSMAGSSPADSSKNVNVGFADILALLSSKTIRELQSSASEGNIAFTAARETPLY
jgi:hypothetical protein